MVVIDNNSPVQAGVQIDGLQENQKIANQLAEIASLLSEQHADEFRVNAYRSTSYSTSIATISYVPGKGRFQRFG